jgi:hypothetical protein
MVTESALTTIDNPWSPFTDFDSWYAYDTRAGHHTSAFLARVTRTSSDLSEADQQLAIDMAIDEIVKENVAGIYVKVTREVED